MLPTILLAAERAWNIALLVMHIWVLFISVYISVRDLKYQNTSASLPPCIFGKLGNCRI